MKRILFFLSVMLMPSCIYAQYFGHGVEAGGFFINNSNAVKLSYFITYRPGRSIFGINSEVAYQWNMESKTNVHQLKIPVGFDFAFGQRKFRVLLGGGAIGGFTLYNSLMKENSREFKNKDFNLELYIDLKLRYQINNKMCIFTRMELDAFSTPVYVREVYVGNHYYERWEGVCLNNSFFDIGFGYKLRGK
jgi:hypothetical protein